MQTPDVLRERITTAAGRGGLAAYRSVGGAYDFGHFQVLIDYTQKEPSGSPTRIRLRVDQPTARFPRRFFATPIAQCATADWIARQARTVLERRAADGTASLTVDAGRDVVLRRTAVRISAEAVELRLAFDLATDNPLTVTATWERVIFSDLPTLAREALLFDSPTSDLLRQHVEAVENQASLREELASRGWVAFLGDGLPITRPGHVGDVASPEGNTLALTAPESLRATVQLANGDSLSGLALPAGVTVIVGGLLGWQGELLRAIEAGVHNHAPGHQRELAVTDAHAWRVRPEEGRSLAGVPLVWFLGGGDDPEGAHVATTGRAGAMESLMAGVVEAVEAGSRVLLFDEAECPTAFLCTDARIRALLGEGGGESSVAPYVDLARALYDTYGVSSILATGSCGEFLEIADTVLVAEGPELRDATAALPRTGEGIAPRELQPLPPRAPDPNSISSQRGGKFGKVSAHGTSSVVFGTAEIPLGAISSLIDPGQLRALGDALDTAKRKGILDGARSVPDVVQEIMARVEQDDLDVVSPHFGRHPGDYAGFRDLELAALIQRYPGVRMRGPGAGPVTLTTEDDSDTREGAARRKRRTRRGRRGEAGAEAPEEKTPTRPQADGEPVSPSVRPAASDEPTEAGTQRRRTRSRGRGSRRSSSAPVAQTEEPKVAATPAAAASAGVSEGVPAAAGRTGRRRRGEGRRPAEPSAPAPEVEAKPKPAPRARKPKAAATETPSAADTEPATAPSAAAPKRRHTRRRANGATPPAEASAPAAAPTEAPPADAGAAAPARRRRRR